MTRRRSGRRRGRPRQHHARWRETTRAGRRGEVDSGSELLRIKRRLLTGSEDFTCDHPLGVLRGRGVIDQRQYNVGMDVAAVVEIAASLLGLRDASAQGVWAAIVAGGISVAATGERYSPAAERARHTLARICRVIGENRTAQLTLAVCGGEWRPGGREFIVKVMAQRGLERDDVDEIERLRRGLERVAAAWSGWSTRETAAA